MGIRIIKFWCVVIVFCVTLHETHLRKLIFTANFLNLSVHPKLNVSECQKYLNIFAVQVMKAGMN